MMANLCRLLGSVLFKTTSESLKMVGFFKNFRQINQLLKVVTKPELSKICILLLSKHG